MMNIYMDKGHGTPVKRNPYASDLDRDAALEVLRCEVSYQADIGGCEIEYAGMMALLRNKAGHIVCRVWAR